MNQKKEASIKESIKIFKEDFEKKIIKIQKNLEKKLEKEDLEKIILVEVPKTVYPEIRGILFYLFEKSGFKNINLEKEVDFDKLYQSKKA